MLHLTALLRMLFKENRAARIGYKHSRSRIKIVAGAVMHLDPAPQKGGIAGHTAISLEGGKGPLNSTKVLGRAYENAKNAINWLEICTNDRLGDIGMLRIIKLSAGAIKACAGELLLPTTHRYEPPRRTHG
jgi:hypothetical protein